MQTVWGQKIETFEIFNKFLNTEGVAHGQQLIVKYKILTKQTKQNLYFIYMKQKQDST